MAARDLARQISHYTLQCAPLSTEREFKSPWFQSIGRDVMARERQVTVAGLAECMARRHSRASGLASPRCRPPINHTRY